MEKIQQIKKTTFLRKQTNNSSLTITMDSTPIGFDDILDFLNQIELPVNNERLVLEKKTSNQLVIQIKN